MFSLQDVCAAMGGTLSVPSSPVIPSGISTDSRSMERGSLFFALTGPNFDGHQFVADAFQKGACAAVVSEKGSTPGPAIVVKDTRRALGELAAAWRKTLSARVIGVTGTNGKTTTKNMIAHMLSKKFSVAHAEKSFNNDIGVPLTLLKARPDHQVVVVEIGTSHPGEIAALGAIACPNVAVITNISEAHLEGLKTVTAVADEKFSILNHLDTGGLAVLNADNEWVYERLIRIKQRKRTFGIQTEADLMATAIQVSHDEITFIAGDVHFRLHVMGRWNVSNALAAALAGMEAGLTLAECAHALEDFHLPAMRMERIVRGEITFLLDAYNANPISMRTAVSELAELAWHGRKVAIVGDMLELGEASGKLHAELGDWIARLKPIDLVIAVGPEMKPLAAALTGHKECHHFDDAGRGRKKLKELLQPGDLVLVKGSRGMKLEQVTD